MGNPITHRNTPEGIEEREMTDEEYAEFLATTPNDLPQTQADPPA